MKQSIAPWKPDGTIVWIAERGRSMKVDADGRPERVQVVGISRDVTAGTLGRRRARTAAAEGRRRT